MRDAPSYGLVVPEMICSQVRVANIRPAFGKSGGSFPISLRALSIRPRSFELVAVVRPANSRHAFPSKPCSRAHTASRGIFSGGYNPKYHSATTESKSIWIVHVVAMVLLRIYHDSAFVPDKWRSRLFDRQASRRISSLRERC